jgi:hypothetical protein
VCCPGCSSDWVRHGALSLLGHFSQPGLSTSVIVPGRRSVRIWSSRPLMLGSAVPAPAPRRRSSKISWSMLNKAAISPSTRSDHE